jgi:membrane-bound serine protease (ClpP class)
VVLLQLDSFGGLGVDAAAVRQVVHGAPVPVAVWVGPRAARAQGAAALLVAGADVVAVSREAVIGPALPAELGRRAGDPDAAAVTGAAGLPGRALRGRLDGAAAITAGVADYEAESLPDAVHRLDGRRLGGTMLSTGDVYELRFVSKSLLDRVLHGLANPTLAYLLLLAAACCLAFEWFQPGFGVAGVAGVVMALLAVYSLAVLPTNWLALGLLVAGFVVFSVDTAVGGLGLGTVAATALTGAGSWWLFSSPSPLLRVDGRLAVLGVAWCLVYFVVVLTVSIRAQRRVPEGTEALVGGRGVVRSTLNPGGIVVVQGAMWRADLVGGGRLDTGQAVTVEAVKEGILQVRAADPDAVKPGGRGRGRRRATAPPVPAGDARTATEDRPRE